MMFKSYRNRQAFKKASSLLAQGKWEEAASAFRRAIAIDPANSWSHNNLANALLKCGAWEESRRAFEAAIALNPDFAESHTNLGTALARLERWDEASRAYRRAIELDARDAASHENLGVALARLERWEEAARAFEQAVALGPNVAERYLNLGIARLRSKRWSDGADALSRALELDPGLEAARQNLDEARAQLAYTQQSSSRIRPRMDMPPGLEFALAATPIPSARWDGADAETLRGIDRNPDIPESHAKLAAALLGQGPREETLAALRRAIDRSPNSVEIHQLLAVALAKLDRREEAALARQRLVANDASNWEALVDLANALAQLERWDEAGAACQKALALHPDVGRLHPEVPALLAKAKLWEEVADVFRRAAVRDPDSVDVHANIAVALANLERWNAAASEFRAAVDAAPDRTKLREALCAVLTNAGRWEDALAASREWVSRDPTSSGAQRQLAAALANLERVDQAAAAHHRIVAAAPEDPATRLMVGIGLTKLGRWEEAAAHLQAGSALNPRDARFPFLLVDPLLRLGRAADAVAAHRRAVELCGAAKSLPERAVDARTLQGSASTWLGDDFTPQVARVERWLAQLGAVREAAPGASRSQPAAPADSGRAPRLLFVLDEDYGELTLLMYLALGQQLFHRSMLLLPDRLFAKNANVFPTRTHRYACLDDVLRRVDAEEPDIVFLCSGYLLSIHGLFSLEDLERLVTQLRNRGCHVVTSDPFLGMLSEHDPEQIVSIHIPSGSSPALKHVKGVEDRRLWSHFAHAEKLFANAYHLYPACDRLPADAVQSDVRNLSSFNPALQCPELAPREGCPPAAGDASRPHWLFILSQTDYEAQAMLESPLGFADIVACRFVEAVALGRRPILIGPNAFLDLLTPRLPTTQGMQIQSYCPFDRLMSLLLSAEHAFYWNVVSHSILIRLFNRLPVVLFDKGHLVRNVPSMYDRVIRWYYRGVEPAYFDHREPLTLERLSDWEEGGRQDADRILAGFRSAPTPDDLVSDLMQRPRVSGLQP